MAIRVPGGGAEDDSSDDTHTADSLAMFSTCAFRIRSWMMMMALIPLAVISNVLLSGYLPVVQVGMQQQQEGWMDTPTVVASTMITADASAAAAAATVSNITAEIHTISRTVNRTATISAKATPSPKGPLNTANITTSTAAEVTASLPPTSLDVTDYVLANPPSTTINATSRSDTLIIGFSDEGYKKIAWKWYQEMNQLGYTEHMVVAQDVASAAYFQEKGMRHDYIHAFDIRKENFNGSSTNNFTNFRNEKCREFDSGYGNNAKQNQLYRRSLFGSRWAYVQRQLQDGHNVLLTDVDNVFVRYKNLSELEAEPFASMHAFAGTVNAFPRNVFRSKGFTICGGMSWLRSSPGVMEIAERLVDRCGCQSTLQCNCYCDDQVVFNNLMLLHDPYRIQWDQQVAVPRAEEEMRWDEMTGTCPKTGHRVKIWNRNVAFRRAFEKNNQVCPDSSKSWIAMPSGLDRTTVHEVWKEACPIDK